MSADSDEAGVLEDSSINPNNKPVFRLMLDEVNIFVEACLDASGEAPNRHAQSKKLYDELRAEACDFRDRQ